MKQYRKKLNIMQKIYVRPFYRYIIKKFFYDCDTVLDVGAGRGIFYDLAKSAGKQATGIDLNDDNIRDNIIKCDLMDYKKQHDGVFSRDLIEHINHWDFMERVSKLCKKKLIVMSMIPCKRFWSYPEHIRPYTKETLKLLFEAYGFKVVYCKELFPTKSVICVGERV